MDPKNENLDPAEQAGAPQAVPTTAEQVSPVSSQPAEMQADHQQIQGTTQPAQPQASIEQGTPKKSKLRKVLIIGITLLVIILVVIGFIYYQYNAQKSAGVKKAKEFVALLESGNRDTAIDEILKGYGVSRDQQPTDSALIQKIAETSRNAGLVSSVLQNADAELLETNFGATNDGDKQTKAHYKITKDNETVYFTVTTKLSDNEWLLVDLTLSQDDPTS